LREEVLRTRDEDKSAQQPRVREVVEIRGRVKVTKCKGDIKD
jgi:hypothetical protein